MSNDREYRAFEFEQKEDDGMMIEGMAVAFNAPTVMAEFDGIKYYEVIDRGAFDNARMDDVVLVINHTGSPAARTKNRSLELPKTESGLFVRADLSRSSIGPNLYQDIKEGIFDKMSFAFTVRRDEYDKETRTRKILEIDRLWDVSVVNFPAYEQTSVSARSFFEAEAELERQHRAEAREKAERLEALIKKIKGDK